MEKYSRGRRGAPAKGVGRIYPAREFKSLLLRQKETADLVSAFSFCLRDLNDRDGGARALSSIAASGRNSENEKRENKECRKASIVERTETIIFSSGRRI